MSEPDWKGEADALADERRARETDPKWMALEQLHAIRKALKSIEQCLIGIGIALALILWRLW